VTEQGFIFHLEDPEQVSQELDRITKLLIRRDLLLNEANNELDEKVGKLEAARKELMQATAYLNSLLANSPDPIWVLDPEGRVTSFNKSAEEITGYPVQEILGQTLDFLFADPAAYHRFLDEVRERHSCHNFRVTIRRRDGGSVDLLMSCALVRGQATEGLPASIIGISKDVTREIRLEMALREANEQLEEKVRQRTCDLENLSQRLAVLNQVATAASQSLELDPLLNNILQVVMELTGFPMGAIFTIDEQECIVVRAHRNIPPHLLGRLRHLKQEDDIIGRAATTGALQASPPRLPEMARSGVRLVVAVPLKAKGAIQGVMSFFASRDRELLEEERYLLLAIGVQAGWAIDNAKLYEQVREDVVKLKEVDRIKTEFIATISHELRTPLTSIVGFLHYAQMTLDSVDQPKLHRYIQVALENGQKLARMIDDLLALQKLESGTLSFHPEPLHLRGLLERLREDLGPQLQAKKQALVIDLPAQLPPVNVDHEQFERVVVNLIVNAIKFSEEPGTITISARHRGKHFTLTVKDTGIGMSPEVKAKIFDHFYQAESSFTRSTGGVGLGLTIAKRIVELHGGTLSVESKPQHGSRFTVMLPERIPRAERAPRTENQA